MVSQIKNLIDELEYYARQLDSVGTVLVDLVRAKTKHQSLIIETGELYQLLTLDLIDIYHSVKRVYRKELISLGSIRKDQSLEYLENIFIILKNAAEEAQAKADSLSRYHTHEAKLARITSVKLAMLTENAAKVLVSEANRKGQWTAEWDRRIGIRHWLR